jgi:hypothetical protein
VSATGSNNAGCPQATPCSTLQYAIDQATNGDTVMVGVRLNALLATFYSYSRMLAHDISQSGTFLQREVNVTARTLSIVGSGASPTIMDCENQGVLKFSLYLAFPGLLFFWLKKNFFLSFVARASSLRLLRAQAVDSMSSTQL